MLRLAQLRISTRLFASFGLLLAISLAIGMLAVSRLSDLAAKSADLSGNWLPSISHLSAVNAALSDLRIAHLSYIASDDPAERANSQRDIDTATALIATETPLYEKVIGLPEERTGWATYQQQSQAYLDQWKKAHALVESNQTQAEDLLARDARPLFDAAGATLQNLIDLNKEHAEATTVSANSVFSASRTTIFGALVLMALLGAAIAVLTARSVSTPLSGAVDIFKKIAAGDLNSAVDNTRGDEIGVLFANLSEMQSKLKGQIERERAAAAASDRIKQALDAVASSVMVADANLEIMYTNHAVETMLKNAEADIRRDLPSFNASQLHGMSLESFHQNPAHQRQMFEGLRSTDRSQLALGGRVFALITTPIITSSGERIGTVVEWAERTQELAIEKEMQGMIGAVNDGDLTRRIEIQGKVGFFETLSRGVNQLAENMTDVVSKVKLAASEVYRGAEEISQGNTNLSQRTEQQSSSLEETASSMEEMTSTVKQNADNASQANQLAVAARDQAEKGGSVVARAVTAMTEINSASNKIADIIVVIDEIAFQTNLLALNAAVEAARAGEQGRGFAVVATEVRALASRSATAAKEIKELIQDSVRKVEDGSSLVTQSGQTLEQIVSSVKKVSDIVAEIAAASREQSAGIEQVNKAVMQMDEMTQQNAALVEEATAASQSMAGQARDLNVMMERYRLAGGAENAGRPVSFSSGEPMLKAVASSPDRRNPKRAFTPKIAKPVVKASSPPPVESKPQKIAGAGGGDDWEEF